MRTIGIIAEYDPFHSGHRYHIRKVREAFGDHCAVVAVMSGHWVQRGGAALADKWIRAKLALDGGVDLVLELPTLWAAASAETFARGGVALMEAVGCVDVLSFGSEAGEITPLEAAAECLRSEGWRAALKRELDRGVSFPVARERAAELFLGDAAACLKGPNNNLGVEYLRAARDMGSKLSFHTLPRLGAGHDQEGTKDAPHLSASTLRKRILEGDMTPLLPYLSAQAEAVLRENPASLTFCTQGVLAKLRGMEEDDFARLPHSGEGLSNRLYGAAQTATTLEDLYALTKTKRFTHARIRRMVLWAFLGLTEADRPALPPYLRVLGFSLTGQQVLRQMKTTASLPVLVKPAHAARLAPEAKRIFDLEARSTRLYELCRKFFGQGQSLNEYTKNPIFQD